MKAYFINPKERSITEIRHDDRDWRNIAKVLGCEWVERVNLCRGDHDAVWVDEEGWLNGHAEKAGWFWLTLDTPKCPTVTQLAGNGLVLGCNQMGENTPPQIDFDRLNSMVSFDRPEG